MINWSGIKQDHLLGKILRFSLKCLSKRMILSIRRGPAQGLKWVVGSATHGCWLGTYELEKQKTLEQFVKPGMTVYDIGAQAGFYSLLFSRLVQHEGKVYAIEPFAENVRHLLAHIQLNHIENLKVIQGALSDQSTLTGFGIGNNNCENSLLEGRNGILMVPVFSLDELIEVGQIAPPNLLKLDVEGAEFQVLVGATRTLKAYKPIVFLALHGNEQRTKCFHFLRENCYEVFNCQGIALDDNAMEDEVYAISKG
ncbi:FkbM family methyltransferase [Candidatus Nitrospira salsa]